MCSTEVKMFLLQLPSCVIPTHDITSAITEISKRSNLEFNYVKLPTKLTTCQRRTYGRCKLTLTANFRKEVLTILADTIKHVSVRNSESVERAKYFRFLITGHPALRVSELKSDCDATIVVGHFSAINLRSKKNRNQLTFTGIYEPCKIMNLDEQPNITQEQCDIIRNALGQRKVSNPRSAVQASEIVASNNVSLKLMDHLANMSPKLQLTDRFPLRLPNGSTIRSELFSQFMNCGKWSLDIVTDNATMDMIGPEGQIETDRATTIKIRNKAFVTVDFDKLPNDLLPTLKGWKYDDYDKKRFDNTECRDNQLAFVSTINESDIDLSVVVCGCDCAHVTYLADDTSFRVIMFGDVIICDAKTKLNSDCVFFQRHRVDCYNAITVLGPYLPNMEPQECDSLGITDFGPIDVSDRFYVAPKIEYVVPEYTPFDTLITELSDCAEDAALGTVFQSLLMSHYDIYRIPAFPAWWSKSHASVDTEPIDQLVFYGQSETSDNNVDITNWLDNLGFKPNEVSCVRWLPQSQYRGEFKYPGKPIYVVLVESVQEMFTLLHTVLGSNTVSEDTRHQLWHYRSRNVYAESVWSQIAIPGHTLV